MSGLRFADTAKLVVQSYIRRWRREFDFLGNFSVSIHFHNPAWPALHDEHAAVRQWLAGVNFRIRAGFVFPDDFFVRRHFERAADLAEKIIAIGEPPAILRRGAGVFPFDFS